MRQIPEWYDKVKDKDGLCKKLIYRIICKQKGTTAKEIATRLNWDIMLITPRIFELKKIGSIVENGTKTNENGFEVAIYRQASRIGIT